MSKLEKYTLDFEEKKDKWEFTNDRTSKVVGSFVKKEDATTGGVLKKILGQDGGSVKIQKMNGRIQEERTYPGSKDPRKSKG